MRTRARIAVLLLTAAFFFRGLFLNLALPYGDPLDEIFHYGYASYFAETGRVPRGEEASVAVECFRPFAWLPRSTSFPGPRQSWKEFSSLSHSERTQRRAEAFRFIPAQRRGFVAPNYETQQPPLAYLAVGWLLTILSRAPLDQRLLALRIAASALAASAVPLVYAFFRRLFPKPSAVAASVAFVAFPGVGSFVGRFTNDALALPLVAALLLLFLDISQGRFSRRRAVALAIWLALGCWTKLYVLLLLPMAPVVSFLATRKARGVTFARSVGASLAAFLLFCPWMLFQHARTGDWWGLTETKQAVQEGVTALDRLRALAGALTPRSAIIFGRTFLWPGTWSAMGAPRTIAVPLVLVLLLLFLVPGLTAAPRSRRRQRAWLAAAVSLVLLGAGYLLHAGTFAAVARRLGHAPSGGPEGWYLLILLPVVLTAGAVFGRSVPARLFLAASMIFVIADWWMSFGVLSSVYAGWTQPNASNAPLSSYGPILLAPVQALKTFERVSLVWVRAPWLAAVMTLWLLSLFSAACLSFRRGLT